MTIDNASDQNWEFIKTLLPSGWEEMARTSGAVQRCRGFDNVGNLLRTLFLHVGIGCSLRETSVAAKAAGWVRMSDVALLNKLRNSKEWLRWMCVQLLSGSNMAIPTSSQMNMRLIDGTDVKEPGKTGSLWRMHYSLSIPGWTCDSFKITPCNGKGSGESLTHFDVAENDCLIADRGYSHAADFAHVHENGGYAIVRLHPHVLNLEQADGKHFEVLDHVRMLTVPMQSAQWPLWITTGDGHRVSARLCAVRKSEEARMLAERKVGIKARKRAKMPGPKALEYARWMMVITTVPEEKLSLHEVLEWYRIRWQIELAFKRLKTLAEFGHLPKYDDDSSKAWLYGKLLVALLTERMRRYAESFFPCGCHYADERDEESSRCAEDETECEQMARNESSSESDTRCGMAKPLY